MNHKFCINEKEWKEAKATLLLAKELGLIDDADLEALEKRRLHKNEEIKIKKGQGELVYGLTVYSVPAYLQYELTRFKLDFISGSETVKKNYVYHIITEEEKKTFYEKHPELFTRYFGDSFSYEDVSMIIEKRLREAEYEGLIQDLLCQL